MRRTKPDSGIRHTGEIAYLTAKHDAINETGDSLLVTKRLTDSTATKSGYEEFFKRALLREEIPVVYESVKLPFNSRPLDRYTPDFLLPFHYVNGKCIIIEPHSPQLFSVNHLRNLNAIRRTYAVYIIMGTNVEQLFYRGISTDRVLSNVDELWDMSNNERYCRNQIKSNIDGLMGKVEMRSSNALEDILAKKSEIMGRYQKFFRNRTKKQNQLIR